jgi:hypothetical protein
MLNSHMLATSASVEFHKQAFIQTHSSLRNHDGANKWNKQP